MILALFLALALDPALRGPWEGHQDFAQLTLAAPTLDHWVSAYICPVSGLGDSFATNRLWSSITNFWVESSERPIVYRDTNGTWVIHFADPIAEEIKRITPLAPLPHPRALRTAPAATAALALNPRWERGSFAWSAWLSATNWTLEKSTDLRVWTPIIMRTNSDAVANVMFDLSATNASAFYRVRATP